MQESAFTESKLSQMDYAAKHPVRWAKPWWQKIGTDKDALYFDSAQNPHPTIAGPGGERFVISQAQSWQCALISITSRTMHCNVCMLVCNPLRKGWEQGFVEGAPGAANPDDKQSWWGEHLMLCDRHHFLMTSLADRHVPEERWPSNLIRGIITHYFELIQRSAAVIQELTRHIPNFEWAIQNTPTTKQQVAPTPIIGASFNPLVVGSWTNYMFFAPRVVTVPDPAAQQAIRSAQFDLGASRQTIALEQENIDRYHRQMQKYTQILQAQLSQYPGRFRSCLFCGQSEIPLEDRQCFFCGKASMMVKDEPTPKDALVVEVDPDGHAANFVDNYWRAKRGLVPEFGFSEMHDQARGRGPTSSGPSQRMRVLRRVVRKVTFANVVHFIAWIGLAVAIIYAIKWFG